MSTEIAKNASYARDITAYVKYQQQLNAVKPAAKPPLGVCKEAVVFCTTQLAGLQLVIESKEKTNTPEPPEKLILPGDQRYGLR